MALSETSSSLWRKTSCPWSVKIRKLSATSLGNYKTPISTQDLSTVAHQLLAPLNRFYGSMRGGDRAVSLPWGVRFLSCSWDLTRAFYNLFLYNTQNERLKTSTRLNAGVGTTRTSLQMHSKSSWERRATGRLSRCCSEIVMVQWDNTHEVHRTVPGSWYRFKNIRTILTAIDEHHWTARVF